VGTIGAPHGIAGDVRLRSETDPAEAIFDYAPWILEKGGRRCTARVVERGRSGMRLLVRLDCAATPEEARLWSGSTILVPRRCFPPLPAGRYYYFDLLSLRVLDEDDAPVGTVETVAEAPAQPLLHVRDGARLRLVPFVWEEIVLAVDLEEGIVRVRRAALSD
jgi:16S rRNA processing protein RimM